MRHIFALLCVCALGVAPLVGCDETQPECQSAEDCGDGNECTEDVCDPVRRTCSNPPLDDGTGCTFDGIDGVCVSGVCGENLCEGVVCEDDGNECTGDVCNFADGTCNLPAGTPCTTGACRDGACTALTTVSGEVVLITPDSDDTPADGATVSVVGTLLSTTTDEDGQFSLEVFPGDWFFHMSKEGTWGFITGPGPGGAFYRVFAPEAMEKVERDVGLELDETKGAVFMDFHQGASRLGGETATLSEPYEFATTFDANGNFVLSDKLLPRDTTLQFFNVEPTKELTVIPRGVEGVNTCFLIKPEALYPVIAKSVTFVSGLMCDPVP